MAVPIWSTTAGKIATINEREYYSLQLSATDSDGDSLTYSKISGTLPPGISISSSGLLHGTPFEVARRSLFTFVIRVSDGTNVADRNFSLEIIGEDSPSFLTATGNLDLSDSTRPSNFWVLDGSEVQFQIQAIDSDTVTGQTLVYDIIQGSLPPGLSMSTSGFISGVIDLAEDIYGPIGGYAGDETYDDYVYDRTVFTKSRSVNYDFIVRVSDGVSNVSQANSIFVYTADFFRVDNNRLTVDQTTYNGFPLVMSLSANRRPIFQTGANLGTFRHNNSVNIKIDVVDFDPLQASLEYSIVSGSMPSGLTIDVSSGEITGILPNQSAVKTDYNFTVRAKRVTYTGVNVYTDQNFSMSVIGDVNIGLTFVTDKNLGSLRPGVPCLLNVEAISSSTNRVITYQITKGQLPTGLTLSEQGNIIGEVELLEFTSIDNNQITFDSNTLSFDRSYTFTVSAGDQYQSQSTSKEFTLKISMPYSKEYGRLQGQGLISNKKNSLSDRELFYQIQQDPNINNTDNVFRSEDPNFGMPKRPDVLLLSGLERKTLSQIQTQMELNHEPKTLYFSDIKTAVAKENGVTKYEVVYLEMIDPLVNNDGQAVSKVLNFRSDISQPMIGPRADDLRLTTDVEIYNVTTDGGLSFSISGSKIRYANPLSADIGYFEKMYPNAVKNMQTQMKALGHKDYVHLPLWMRTAQSTKGIPLGFTLAVVLCYCKPGKSAFVKKRILDKNIDFKKSKFVIDRYVINRSAIDNDTFTGDGSTISYTLNEIVHEEDIKVRNNSRTLFYGKTITADNDIKPTYLRADTTLRSSDFEPDFTLTHDTTNKKSTIVLTNAISDNNKLRVGRKHDKYVVFKRKGKE